MVIDMRNRELSSREKVTFTGLDDERESLKLMGYYVAVPGAVGGIAKVAHEAIDPNLGATELSWEAALPVYGFLGAVSSVLAVAVISDSIKKTHIKLIGISLACGLVFPAVLSSSASIVRLQTELNSAKVESNQIAERAINQIEKVAETSNNNNAKKSAIASVNEIAEGSKDTKIKAEAANTIAEVSSKTENVDVQIEAIKNLKNIAIDSDSPEVRKSVLKTLNSFQDTVYPIVKVELEQAIAEIGDNKLE